MSSWFADKVNNLVREVRIETQKATAAATGGPRSADELAAELENQARRVSGPQAAIDLLSKWVERSDSGHGAFTLGGAREGDHGLAEPLSFYQAFLRSQALEVFVDVCGKVSSLRNELLRGGPLDEVRSELGSPSPLSQALCSLVERLLLPGALAVWPTLLEVLLASGAADEAADRAAKAGKAVPESRCGSWARRALALVKRQWEHETMPAALRCLDRKLTALVSTPAAPEDTDANAELLRSGKRISKGGIRAALAKDKLKRFEAEASRLRSRTELLCDACARLEVAESSSATDIPEADQLLEAADAMLAALDAGVKELSAEQESLRTSLQEVSQGLEKQIAEFKETISTFSSKREALEEEKSVLTRRLEEVQLQLTQVHEATTSYERRSTDLEDKLRDTTQHFEERIAGCFCQQRRLADEKLRAVACKACAHTARDVVSGEEQRRSEELAMQLRRRRADLRRTCAAYIRKERYRIESVADAYKGEGGGSSSSKALTKVEKAWREAQDILQRALPLCRDDASKAKGPDAAAGAGTADEAGDVSGEAPQEVTLQEAPPEDAASFFAKEAARGQTCIDCRLPDADWATVSCGSYLCVDCAGRHRGLGVHLSFVRSTTMDIWSKEQLRRMHCGGSARFRDFLKSYPKLLDEPQTSAALLARYNSRAVFFYRRLLDLRCEGKATSQLEPPPAPEEGHLPAATSPDDESKGQRGSVDGAEDEEAPLGSVEEEVADLEVAYERHKHGPKEGVEKESPGSPCSPEKAADESSAPEPGGAPLTPPPLCTGVPQSPPSMESPSQSRAAAQQDQAPPSAPVAAWLEPSSAECAPGI